MAALKSAHRPAIAYRGPSTSAPAIPPCLISSLTSRNPSPNEDGPTSTSNLNRLFLIDASLSTVPQAAGQGNNASGGYEEPKAVAYIGDKRSWFLEIYNDRHELTSTALREKLVAAARLPLEVQLHDVLIRSLVPLTRQYRADSAVNIVEQALSFFTSFEENAQWHISVDTLPQSIGAVINGLTPNSRNSDIGFRFMRFRFPYITFEWFLQTPYSDLVEGITSDSSVEVEFHWKAWSRTAAASGLVAYGTIKDTMNLRKNNGRKNLIIAKRHFIVTQVFQPELMRPEFYPLGVPALSQQGDVMLFTTSWTVIQFLRSSQICMAFLVAISALFAALQPIVGRFSTAGGWVFAAIGVVSGILSVGAVVLGWVLTMVEKNAARRRQSVDE